MLAGSLCWCSGSAPPTRTSFSTPLPPFWPASVNRLYQILLFFIIQGKIGLEITNIFLDKLSFYKNYHYICTFPGVVTAFPQPTPRLSRQQLLQAPPNLIPVAVLRLCRHESLAAPVPQGRRQPAPHLHGPPDHAPLPAAQHLPAVHPVQAGHYCGCGE